MYHIDKTNWILDEDQVYFNSIGKIGVPWLNNKFDLWIDTEENYDSFTALQLSSLTEFLAFPNSAKAELKHELQIIYRTSIDENRIVDTVHFSSENVINWEETQICVPKHHESTNKYVFLLAETHWKIQESEFCLELEILYVNGAIELAQEMSGLWCRPEWKETYGRSIHA